MPGCTPEVGTAMVVSVNAEPPNWLSPKLIVRCSLAPQATGDPLGGLQFDAVALAVIEGQAVAGKALATREGETGSGIESAGKEDHSGFHGSRIYSNLAVDRVGRYLFLRYNSGFCDCLRRI